MNPLRDGLYRLFVGLQWVLPHHLLSAAMFHLARVRWRPIRMLLIRGFIRWFRPNLEEARVSDPSRYEHFNAFFTRALRPDARPLDPEGILAPVDGTLSQFGTIEAGQLVQAKGSTYGVADLLGSDEIGYDSFLGGHYATLYLSPRDYHRIHMPLAGTLRETRSIPGRLFSVNPITTARVPRLFTRNERLVCLFETHLGPLAVILVGAIFVGSIETVWAGPVFPRRGRIHRRTYEGEAVRLARGAELGRFNLGSTVILLLPPGAGDRWHPRMRVGAQVRMGERLLSVKPVDRSPP